MLLDSSGVWVIGFGLMLSILLDRLALRPVTDIVKARAGAIRLAGAELVAAIRVPATAIVGGCVLSSKAS